jgi:hypothetical protein
VTWQVAGIGPKVHREQLESGLPDDLAAEFHSLSQWAHGLPQRYGSRVTVRLVDAASIEGFFKSLFRRFRRYPAFVVNGRKYVGSDFSRVDALISQSLPTQSTASRVERRGRASIAPEDRVV